jgi:hypothetical protein
MARSRREVLLLGSASSDAASVTVTLLRVALKQRSTAAALARVVMEASQQVP